MGGAIGEMLPLAIGIAISPLAIVAVILILTTPQARTNGLAFLGGWLLALAVVGGVALVVDRRRRVGRRPAARARSSRW